MKKLLQMKFMLLLCALIVGSGTMWAEDVTTTYIFTNRDWNATCGGEAANWTCNTRASGYTDGQGTQITTSGNGANATSPVSFTNVKSIVVTYCTNKSKGNGTIKVKIGSGTEKTFTVTAPSSDGTTLKTTEFTYNPTESGAVTLTVNCSTNSVYIYSIAITTESANTPSSPLASITLSGEYPTSFYVGDAFSHEGMTVTATYDDNTTKDVTTGATFSGYDMSTAGVQTVTVSYTQGEGDNAITKSATYNITVKGLSSVRLDGTYPVSFTEGDAFSHEGMTVYAVYTDGTNESEEDVTSDAVFSEPDMTIVGNQNVTVSYTKNNVTKSTEYEITINALPTHNVTWSVNGTVTQQESYKEGAAITFPANPADIEGKSFVGWTETAISGTTDETPTFVTSATMGNADIFLYAVFATVEGTSVEASTEITGSTAGLPTSYGNANMFSEYTLNGIKYAIQQMYKSGEKLQWRAGGHNSGTGTMYNVDAFQTIKSVVLTYNSSDSYKNFTLKVGNDKNPTDGTAITPVQNENVYTFDCSSANCSYFVLANGTNAGYLDKITINYTTGTQTVSGYCTTVAADTREEAGLSFAESKVTVEWYDAAEYTGQALTNPNGLPVTWTSSNEEVATVENGTVKVLALGETTIKASFDGDNNYKKGEASYTLTVQDSRTALVLSFDPESVEVNVNETVAIPTLNGNLGNATVTYASGDANIATVTEDANTSLVVTGLAEGTTTITATVAATNEYKEGTATFTVTVIDPNKKGSVNNPYTVDEARAAIDAGTGVTEVYATGIVSEIVTAFNSQYGNITYNISADGLTTSDQLQAYRGKGIGGADFTSADDIKVGDVVVIYGTLKKYGSTYEFGEGNQLVSLERPSVPAIIVAEATINVDASSQSITRGITVNNLTITGADNFHIKYYNANDEEVEKPSWIEEATVTVENSAYVLSCTVAANEGDERTAYLKVYAMNGDETIYSNLVTITQAKYVPDYATLPFEFDGGLNDIESTSGLTQNGLGTDYSSKPKLKFDNTGDYLVLKIDEAPGKLTFNIKGNGFSGSTFSVQTSADGVTFTDLASYTSIGSDTETKEFDDLADNVRYIKWVYTEKVSGNVGLGNINLAKPITDPVIKLAETSVEVDAKQHDGTIALTYKNLQIDSMDDFDVQFYSDEQGTVTADAPEWVEALVAAQAPNVGPGYVLSYVIDANDGAERTAYLRVYANDGVKSVSSDVVTITQAKFVKTTTYTLAHAITPGKHYVIASGNVGTVYVMGEQKNTNRDAVYGAEVNFSEVLSVTEDIAADVREFIISKDGNYYTIFDFDENESGYLYASSTSDNHLKTKATNNDNGKWTITIDEEGVATLKANMTGRNWMRFNGNNKVFSCYGENSNQQDIYLFEKDNDEGSLVIPIAAACTDGTKCYSTFSSTKPFVVPEDLTVSEIGIDTDGTMNVENYETGAVVPANTGVMVSAAAGDRSYVANVSTEVGNNVLNGDNRLRPTGDNGLAATEMNSAEPETCKFYRLTMHGAAENNPGKIGFWWGADGGQSFDIVANKAYLAVPASVAGTRNGFAFGDDATGINNVNVNENGSVFDLQGRKVSTPGKGLYIVNGKKVVIK